MLSNQSRVLQQLVKNFAKNVFMGQSIMNISIPVTVFEPQSLLERICEQFTLFPTIMKKINDKTKLIDQIKLCTTHIISSMIFQVGITKPFNPILGETKQYIIDSYSIDVEQISHHPPISYFYIKSDNIRHYGSHKLNVQHQANNVIVRQEGDYFIEIYGNKFLIISPEVKVLNTLVGQRKMGIQGFGAIFDVKNDIVAFYKIKNDKEPSNSQNKVDQINGGIYQLKSGLALKYFKKKSVKFESSDIVNQLSTLSGNYTDKIYFDDTLFFDFQNEQGYKLIQKKNPLVSDSIFRKDSLYLKAGLIDQSQSSKDQLENEERSFQILRKQNKN